MEVQGAVQCSAGLVALVGKLEGAHCFNGDVAAVCCCWNGVLWYVAQKLRQNWVLAHLYDLEAVGGSCGCLGRVLTKN